MFGKKSVLLLLVSALSLALIGCESMPGTRKQQGAAIGGTAGAVTGAAIADNSLLGALIGGVIGAGGGYVIASETDKGGPEDERAAANAAEDARQNPATAQEARNAQTADINQDGFVTMDEIVALSDAGLSDDEMIRKLEATDQVFELTEAQENDLQRQGVSSSVIEELPNLNRELLYGSPSDRDDVISRSRENKE